jgi:four helix bundle protein
MVYKLTGKERFAKDFGLKGQIRKASSSSMNNIAGGFDADANTEFIRFLRYAERSCSEVQSELYIALDHPCRAPWGGWHEHIKYAMNLIVTFIIPGASRRM